MSTQERNASICKDLERSIARISTEKEDALQYNQYAEAERCHYKVVACKEAIEYLADTNEDVLTEALLDACRQLEADRPRAIAQCKVFGAVLKTLRGYPARLAIF